jgi:hypothetical protein
MHVGGVLAETGFVEGRNVAFEYRWDYNDPSRLPELAADLVRHHVTVIAALNGSSALAANFRPSTPPVFGSAISKNGRGQLVRVVVAYVEARSKRMHEPFWQLTYEALADAWPCNKAP